MEKRNGQYAIVGIGGFIFWGITSTWAGFTGFLIGGTIGSICCLVSFDNFNIKADAHEKKIKDSH